MTLLEFNLTQHLFFQGSGERLGCAVHIRVDHLGCAVIDSFVMSGCVCSCTPYGAVSRPLYCIYDTGRCTACMILYLYAALCSGSGLGHFLSIYEQEGGLK